MASSLPALPQLTPSERAARDRSPSRQGRPRQVSPVNSYFGAPSAAIASAASSSAGDSASSDSLSDDSRCSSPPTEAEQDDLRKSGCPCAHARKANIPQLSTEQEQEAIAAIRARPTPTAADQDAQPLLYLPPFLSLLPLDSPASSASAPGPSLFDAARAPVASTSASPASPDAPVAYTSSRLPRIDPASLAFHRALHSFRPITPHYATSPYADSFNWRDLRLEDDPTGRVKREEREWYIVAFRSRRNIGLPEDRARRLYEADRAAHEEAVTRGGLILYWYGNPVPYPSSAPAEWGTSIDDVGRNLATCVWQSRADAIAAMRGEKHKEAARLASTTYEYYTLERYIVRKEPGELSVRIFPWHGGEVAGAV
ncbi:hypothetical protein JCM10450v2_004706 [Rhodotorula kratochvilovae]